MARLALDPARRRYQALIGTGGIGSGAFFALNGNHTLGREESRSGHFLKRRDYCKLHIVAHYVATLIGPDFATIPAGKVGDDDAGRQLVAEMRTAGLELRHVAVAPDEPTLYSLCFIYPDGAGGNLTVDDSACARVDPAFVAQSEADFAAYAGRGIALAMPEVPLEVRAALLDLGTRYRFLRAASFLSSEMAEVRDQGFLERIDLLAINRDEAIALTDLSEDAPAETVVVAVIKALKCSQRSILLSVTALK